MPKYIASLVVVIGTLLWFVPFLLAKWNFKAAEKIDLRARWGMLLQLTGYAILWIDKIWSRSPVVWQVVLAGCLFFIAALCSFTSVRVLGRQLRLDAGLIADHQLVRSGPYRFVRHPIYTSVVCAFLATGLVVASWPWLLGASVLCLIGTEIRVRVEDALLASRFRDEFSLYQRSVPAYIPLIR